MKIDSGRVKIDSTLNFSWATWDLFHFSMGEKPYSSENWKKGTVHESYEWYPKGIDKVTSLLFTTTIVHYLYNDISLCNVR